MTAHAFTRALRFAVVFLALACESRPQLMGPQVELRASRSTGSPTANLGGAFTTPSPQAVTIVAENKFKLELHADQALFQDAIELINTIAGGTIDCVTDVPVSDDRKAALLLKLRDALQNRFFNAYIDKSKLGAVSEQHRIAHTWNEPDGGSFTVRIGSAPSILPGVFATATQLSKDVFTFSGGAVMIADRAGQVADHVYMACVNLDAVTLTLTR